MTGLNRKLTRDLWRLRGQVLAVAMVIASGVAVLVMSLSAMESLDETARAYYERYRFAHVFADVKRAPERLAKKISQIPGVQGVETRIVELAVLDVEGFEEPALGQVVSLPERGEPLLNRLALRAGRLVSPGRPDEVVLSEPFAEEHGLEPGDRLVAILKGHRRTLDVVGVALSPEFVHAIGPGALMPDDEHFGILWMGREALEAAFDLDGAFNNVALSLLRGAQPQEVIDRVDTLLDRYGGVGAFDRADQISNWFLMNEIEQLRNMSSILPAIFLSVAAFLTNMVLARLIATERSEIGLLKAFGYSDWAVSWHYIKLVAAMAGLGILIGWGVGYWLGYVNTTIYAELYRFPFLYFRPGPGPFALGAVISLIAAMLGALSAVRRAASLPPAEAMRPPAPPRFSRGQLGDLLARWLDQPTRIVLRQIFRWPFRAFLTTTGIAMSVAVMIMALEWLDAIDHMIDVYYFQSQRQDVTIGLTDPESSETLRELARLPGVMASEPFRTVKARLRNGVYSKREAIQGIPSNAVLNLVYDAGGQALNVPKGGLVISSKLAEILNVERGGMLTVEVLEGRRPKRQMPVLDIFETYIGTPAYMEIGEVSRMMRERPQISGAHLRVDVAELPALYRETKETPKVAAVLLRRTAIDLFEETVAETVFIYIAFFAGFAVTLAVGTTYNSARIALSERGRDLATLRVLGFSRAEVSYILLGEVVILTLVAMPLGCLFGFGLAWIMISTFDTELFRVPLVIHGATYGYAMLLGLAAAAVTAALVRMRIDRLDLIAVLKTRE